MRTAQNGKVACMALLSLSLGGCASWVTVEKASTTSSGLRYSLTSTYLLMKPASDGTVIYEWLSLPDRSKEYAVKTRSLFSTYTMDVELEHGILKKVTAKPDSSAVATSALGQAATVLQAQETAEAKTAEAQSTAASAAIDSLKTELATAEATERKAKVEYDKAAMTEKLYKPPSDVTPQERLAAAVATKLAEIDLSSATAEVARLKALLAATPGARVPGARKFAGDPPAKAWGPLLFRVVQTNGAVKLQAVNLQEAYETYGATVPKDGS
jgi:hypothetical protein